MKTSLLILFAAFFTSVLYAQNAPRTQGARPQQALPPPLALRQVSGIVKDTTDATLPGAVIKLQSAHDTISTSSNMDGVFIFKNVKSATFVLTVSSVGYRTMVKKFLNNDAVPRLTLDPVILKSESTQLKTVTINGTPSITYKVDTVEYRASDYKVRPNATLDELLKKMEGFEVGTDGSVTHQGEAITKLKLNGKEYAGGDVAQAIQNLPADIIEKAQVVDDYGDQAARTGIKDDANRQKILNVTTKADRSVGTTGRITGQAGNNGRYNAQLFVQRINANQQLGVIGRLQNTVNGVASAGLSGGATNGGGGGSGVGANGGRGGSSPGTTKSGAPSINYRDQWSKKLQVIGSYSYRFNNNNSYNNETGERYTSFKDSSGNPIKSKSVFGSQSTRQNNTITHNFNLEMDYTIDSANYMQFTPSFSYSSSNNTSNSYQNLLNFFPEPSPGFSHQTTNGITNSTNSAPNYGMIVFYQHIFKKPRRNASVQLSITRTNSQANGDNNNDFRFYRDTTLNTQFKDSLVHLLTDKYSANTTYRVSTTYVEPLSQTSQIEFNGQIRRAVYDNQALSDTVLTTGEVINLPRLSNIYNYSFTETRATFNYRYNGSKVNLSIGTTLVPYTLDGTKVNNGTSANVSSSRNDFRILPVFRFSYAWSRTQRLSITYGGTNTEPQFQQIQPFVDRSNPDNIIVGNPDLRATLSNSITAAYNNYFPNSRFNISFNVNGTFYNDQITTNTIPLTVEISPEVPGTGTTPTVPAKNKIINEVHYVNIDGSQAIVGRYNISKQLADRKYNLSLNGNVTYSYSNAMYNNILYHSTNWRFDERFGPRISPSDNVEINPFVGYDISRSFSSSVGATASILQTTSLGLDGKFYFFKTYEVNYSATKSIVTGLGALNTSPLVINAGFEKEFFQKRNLVLTFNVFDLLHQNNFTQQTVTAQGFTNTLSSTLSRYFLVGVRLSLQKWSGSPKRNGRNMQRRGDGSYIYN